MVLRQNNRKILNIVLSENDDSYLVMFMYSRHGGCLQGLVVITMCLTQCKVCREICSCLCTTAGQTEQNVVLLLINDHNLQELTSF